LIIVLKDGQVAEQGTHEQLNDRGGLYSELWSAQEMLFTEGVEEELEKDEEEEEKYLDIDGKGRDVK
jgi:ABC transporter ATM